MPTRLADGLGLESALSFPPIYFINWRGLVILLLQNDGSEFAPKIGFPAFMFLHMNLGYNSIVESNYPILNSKVNEILCL